MAQNPTPTPEPAAAQSESAPAWVAFERVWAGIDSYSATVTAFEQRGTQAQNAVFDYTFRKPSTVTAHIVKGPDAGATLDWAGGDTVVAHLGGGFLSLFKKTYGLHDAAVTSIRGSSIDQLSFAAILAHVRDTPGTVTDAPGPVIDGVPTKTFTLTPTSPAADADLTQEVIEISSATNLPLRILGYEGSILVRDIEFANVKVQPGNASS